MKQKRIDDFLYVYSLEPYVITDDTDVEKIFVQEELIEKYKVLNPSIENFNKINYNLLSVETPVYLEYRFEPDPEPEPEPDFYFSENSIDVYNSGETSVNTYLVNESGESVSFSSNNQNIIVNPETGVITFASTEEGIITATSAVSEYTAQITVNTHYTEPEPEPTKKNLEVELQSLRLSANSTKTGQNVLKIPNTSTQGFTYNESEWSIVYGEGLSGTGAITSSGGSTLSIKTDIVTPAYNGTYYVYVNFTGNDDFNADSFTTEVTVYGGSDPEPEPSEKKTLAANEQTKSMNISSNPTKTQTFLSIPTYVEQGFTWNANEWTITTDPSITINYIESGVATSGVDLNVKANITASVNGTFDVNVTFAGNDDFNPNSWTSSITISGASKPTADGYWMDDNQMRVDNVAVIAGDSSTSTTLTFNGTPSTGWTFEENAPVNGITFDNSTGEISIDTTNMDNARGVYQAYAHYGGDSSYESSDAVIEIDILPSGSNINFYFEDDIAYISNQNPETQPMLVNNTGETVTFTSSDTDVFTVDNNGMITYVAPGTATLTATGQTVSASIPVTCELIKSQLVGTQHEAIDITIPSGQSEVEYGETVLVEIENFADQGYEFDKNDFDVYENGEARFHDSAIIEISGTSIIVKANIYADDAGTGDFTIYFNKDGISKEDWEESVWNIPVYVTKIPDFYFDEDSIDVFTSGETTVNDNLVNESGESVTFSSNNQNITVDPASGVITYESDEEGIITATSATSGYTAQITVTTHI